jgi:hypothetical protein
VFIASLITLAVCIAAAVLAVFSGHIPVLRDWTGAAPLLPEDEATVTARDFAASDAAGYVTRPDFGPHPPPPRRRRLMNPEMRLFLISIALSSTGIALIAISALLARHDHRKGGQ